MLHAWELFYDLSHQSFSFWKSHSSLSYVKHAPFITFAACHSFLWNSPLMDEMMWGEMSNQGGFCGLHWWLFVNGVVWLQAVWLILLRDKSIWLLRSRFARTTAPSNIRSLCDLHCIWEFHKEWKVFRKVTNHSTNACHHYCDWTVSYLALCWQAHTCWIHD